MPLIKVDAGKLRLHSRHGFSRTKVVQSGLQRITQERFLQEIEKEENNHD